MNLRLPAVICIVGVAGAAAVARTLHQPAAAPAAAAFVRDDDRIPVAKPSRTHAVAQAETVVYVAGAVVHSGVYRVPARARAVDALRLAGGATSAADLVAINLAALLADGDEVIVPEKGAAEDVTAGDSGTASHRKKHKRHRKSRHKRSHRRAVQTADSSATDVAGAETADTTSTNGDAAPAAPIDLNTADASEIETLPGIGTKLAERIVSYRDLNGPFIAHDDLLDVGGMTQKRLDAIEPFLVAL